MPAGLSFEGTGTRSIIKWQTRTDWLATGGVAFKWEAIKEGRELYERDYRLDMHRWITTQLKWRAASSPVDEFKVIIRSFADELGDFFTNNVTANTTEQTIKRWMDEWIEIGMWDESRNATPPATWRTEAEKTIQGKLYRYTSSEVVERKGGTGNYDIAIRPNSWAGFCWALIARDFYDGITYQTCSNFEKCGREVASLSLQGNKQEHCSNTCTKASARRSTK